MRLLKIKLSNIKHCTINKLTDIHHSYVTQLQQLMNILQIVLGVDVLLKKIRDDLYAESW